MPWARPGGGSTLLFEAMVVEPAKSRPVADIAEQVGGRDTRPWRLIRHYVDEACLYEDCTGVEAMGIDGAGRGGHRYITVVADPAERDVIRVVPGEGSTTAKRFTDDFMARNGDPDRVRPATCDMGPGFAGGIRGHLPNAAKVIDRFHVVRHANEAVDKVRKAEAGESSPLKRAKHLWPGNESDLTDRSWRSSAIWRSGGRRPPGRAGCARPCRTSTPTAPAAWRRGPGSRHRARG